MSKVYKYPLQMNDEVSIDMPEGSIPLCVQMQHGAPCLWVRVPDDLVCTRPHKFFIRRTGHPIDDNQVGDYIDTFQAGTGLLVFHVFAKTCRKRAL